MTRADQNAYAESAPPAPVGGSFIERHGLVRYTGRLGRRYPRYGECEVGACRLLRKQESEQRAEWQAEFERIRAALPARQADQLAEWLTEAKRRIARDRRADTGKLIHLGLTHRQVFMAVIVASEDRDKAWDAERDARPLVFDHCHVHGWVRGLVCHDCNVKLGVADAGQLSADHGAWAPLILAFRGNCPDCWRFDVRRLR